jgi:hypothetical protein
MWIIFRLVLFVLGTAQRVFSMTSIGKRFQSHSSGVRFYIRNKKNKKTGKQRSKVYIQIKSRIFFRLLPENAWLRWYKAAGFGQEIQVGDPEFDKAFYIVAENYGVINKFRGDSDLRKSILGLYSRGFKKFVSDGFGHLSLEADEININESDDFFLDLARIKNALNIIPSASFFSEPFVVWAVALEVFFYGLCSYAFSSLYSVLVGEVRIHLDSLDYIFKSFVVVLILVGAWFAAISLLLRRSARAPLLLYEFAVPYSVVAILAGFLLFGDLNQSLDRSLPIKNVAKVVKKFSKSTGGGRRRSSSYYLVLNYSSNQTEVPETLGVNQWVYSDYSVGDGIEVMVRKGFFDSPYIEGFFPATISRGRDNSYEKDSSHIDKAYARKLLLWRETDEKINQLEGTITWREEKYSSGKLRQREPFVRSTRHGVATYWHENGKIYTTINWFNGEKHGRVKLNDQDGRIEQSLDYRNGELHGLCAWYSQTGVVTNMALYDTGVLVSTDLAVLLELGKSVDGIGLK